MATKLDPIETSRKPSFLTIAALVFALTALGLTLWNKAEAPGSVSVTEDRWDRIVKSGVLRVGYGGYPPYTIAGTGAAQSPSVSGFSVDLVNAIASRTSPALKVEWHQFSFDTMRADLSADRFDFIADPVFLTVPRAADFAFSEPYSYFGIAVALIRADDNRFSRFADLDREDITIALAEGWTSSEYARANLTKPTLKSIPVTGDALAQMDEVLLGRADVALNDVPTVLQYVRAHPDKVKGLWLDMPPSSVAGGFVLRPSDIRLKQFLDGSIIALRADGTIDQIDRRWSSLGFFPDLRLKPGAGIGGAPSAQPR
ncbi:transporter substrate-binding domain-containing protein [Niveispirillum sp. SYP-B3756]|uniref:substrate-binding periplasmic protein n=1 Tax=Niveispirillum sp. SYP-B3756 TaxID=2662178 RepID=UPI001290CA44|nr:ABC transporter substrate-binding protein [Niveispirillum sp. SYP-B3756]MQP68538.1 transporter substrate-binding domain-containing protein [Niveispirillum sp. SYP-B3756]